MASGCGTTLAGYGLLHHFVVRNDGKGSVVRNDDRGDSVRLVFARGRLLRHCELRFAMRSNPPARHRHCGIPRAKRVAKRARCGVHRFAMRSNPPSQHREQKLSTLRIQK